MTDPITNADQAIEVLGEALFGLSTRLNIEFLADDANHTAYEKVVAAFVALKDQVASPSDGAAGVTAIARIIAEAMWGPDAASVYFDHTKNDVRYRDSMAAAGAVLSALRPQAMDQLLSFTFDIAWRFHEGVTPPRKSEIDEMIERMAAYRNGDRALRDGAAG